MSFLLGKFIFSGANIMSNPRSAVGGVFGVLVCLGGALARQDDIIGVAFGQGNIPNLR